MRKTLLIILLIPIFLFSQDIPEISYGFNQNINYKSGDDYTNTRCVLDIYFPENSKNFSTIVYFHGGALKRGNKYIPEFLKNKGVAIAAVNYRFYPKVSTSEIIITLRRLFFIKKLLNSLVFFTSFLTSAKIYRFLSIFFFDNV